VIAEKNDFFHKVLSRVPKLLLGTVRIMDTPLEVSTLNFRLGNPDFERGTPGKY
jgi:hypothetical protein